MAAPVAVVAQSPSTETGFTLSTEAVALGFDGRMRVRAVISEDGTTSDTKVFGEPMWPCDVKVKGNKEFENLRKAVKDYVISTKFDPPLKDGKPVKSTVMIDLALSRKFFVNSKMSPEQQIEKMGGATDMLIDVGDLRQRFISGQTELIRSGVNRKGLLLVQMIIDEQGNVLSAGTFLGEPSSWTGVREAACASKFKPMIVNGKNVRMTGTLLY